MQKPTIIIAEQTPHSKEIYDMFSVESRLAVITSSPRVEVGLRRVDEDTFIFPWKKTSALSIKNFFLELDKKFEYFEEVVIAYDIPESRSNYDKINFNDIHMSMEEFLKPYMIIVKEIIHYFNSKNIQGRIVFIFFYSDKIEKDPVISCLYYGMKSYIKGILNYEFKKDNIIFEVIENNLKIDNGYYEYIKNILLNPKKNPESGWHNAYSTKKSFIKNLI